VYSQIASNKRKTIFILLFFLVFVGALGWLFSAYIGDPKITPLVLIGALIYVVISYLSGSKLALSMNGAKEIIKNDNPRLWRTVENLSITDGLPMPKVYIIEDPGMNAFATGRNPQHASVAITTGLMDKLTDSELQGVMAHELGHVKNYDMRVSLIAFALVAVVSIIVNIMWRVSWFGDNDDNGNNIIVVVLGVLAIILAPLIAGLIQLSVSRRREYLADATGALTTRYPEGLISALEKIDGNSILKKQNPSTAHFFFANPIKGSSISNLFSTHPPIEERIKKLRQMGSEA